MRQPALLLAAALASQAAAAAAQTVTIDDLRAPTSPAFVLLDVTPSSVERPENPKSFAVNVINKLTSSSGFPQNYALEVAPYWLTSHPDLTFERYQNPGVFQSVAQTLSFSIATTPLQAAATIASSATASAGTRLGAGVSVNVWNGQPNPKIKPLIDDLVKIDSDIIDDVIYEQEHPDDRAAATKTAADKARATDTALQIQQIDAQRIGFLLTIAAGHVWNYPGDVVETAHSDRRGIWATPAYRFRACGIDSSPCDAFIDAIGVVRALHDPGTPTMWDIGARFLWQPNKELSVSVETLRRRGAAPTRDSSRTVGMLEYRMTADTSLYATFGQDFATAVGNRPLVSLMGLNVGFGNKATVKAQ